MPLHLLGKKSWNVYNPENIAKVRRDEAAAEEREREEEMRMQEADAEHRMQLLRGISKNDVKTVQPEERDDEASQIETERPRPAKRRRKFPGEDDTDRDIRFALENREALSSQNEKDALQRQTKPTSAAPITDSEGYINLFPISEQRGKKASGSKNAEAEKEAAAKKKEYENQYTMRFSNAAGYKQSMNETPWYSSHGHEGPANEEKGDGSSNGKNVWGKEDSGRGQRDAARLEAEDPLIGIKKGVKRVKEIEKGRKDWARERRKEIDKLKEEQRHERRRHRRKSDDIPELNLDDPSNSRLDRKERRHKERHRHRSRYGTSHDVQDHRHRRDHYSSTHSRSHSNWQQ